MTTLITPLPTPPTRQDSFNFNDRADDFLGALPLFQQEANGLAIDVQASAYDVEIARQAVASVANVTKWVSGNDYPEGVAVWSPINGVVYRKMSSTFGGTTDPSIDTVNYKSITDAAGVTYTLGVTGSVITTLQERQRTSVSVLDFGADPTGVNDSTDAFNKAWAHIKQSVESMSSGGNLVSVSIEVPAGRYKASTSINWTGLLCWNIHVNADGVVLRSTAANKPAIDATGVRGLHLKGISIHGDVSLSPSCAILIGPSGTATCGNNKFSEVKTTGVFTKAAFANIGSETTVYDNCYFANNSTDQSAWAFIGDGRNRFGFTSDYTTLRATGIAVSFTNNAFYSCHLRNYGGGNGTYMESAIGWMFDRCCYHLVFDKSNIVIRQDSVYRSSDISIMGLFETSQGAGVKHCVKFVLDEGSFSGITGFEFATGSPHAHDSIFVIENEYGTQVSSGFLKISNASIKIGGSTANPAAPLFLGTGLYIMGDIHARNPVQINLNQLSGFHGTLHTSDASAATLPTSGNHSYIIFDESSLSGQVVRIGGLSSGQVGLQGGSLPTIRAEGENTDLDLKLQGKGGGLVRFGTRTATADAPVTGYIEIKDALGQVRKLAVIS